MPDNLANGRNDSKDKGQWAQLRSPVFSHLVQHHEESTCCSFTDLHGILWEVNTKPESAGAMTTHLNSQSLSVQSSHEDNRKTWHEPGFEPHELGINKSWVYPQPSWSSPPKPKRDMIIWIIQTMFPAPFLYIHQKNENKKNDLPRLFINLHSLPCQCLGSQRLNRMMVHACFSIFRMGRMVLYWYLSLY